ncbi:glycosyltransferase family 4 protein [Halioglobus sp. Uisw_031]|uniref:glycosyltransferase family 4 protein n=1 Tax=Halioglobus sp. Uisw_031 TaxID=3230977 RepID=UPI0039E893AB
MQSNFCAIQGFLGVPDLRMKASSQDEKPRVLIFHPALAPYRLDLFNAFGEVFNLKIVFLRKNLLNQKFDQKALLGKLNVEHSFLAKGVTLRGQSFRLGASREIREFSPDIVITPEYSMITASVCLCRVLLRRRFAQVVWSDDNSESSLRDSYSRKLLRYLIIPRVQGVILISEEAISDYRSRHNCRALMAAVPIIREEKLYVEELEASSGQVEQLIRKYSLSGRKVLLFVGRLAREKRIDRLIRAYADILSKNERLSLVLVGDGPLREELELLAKELGIDQHVVFPGRQEHEFLAAWYRVGGVFVLPSESELFGAVVNEALLAGMPVICSNKAGARVLIQHKKSGVVVDAANFGELKGAVLEYLRHCAPVSNENVTRLRPSLMTAEFNAGVDQVRCLVEKISAGRIER